MRKAKAFFVVCAGIFLLALSYHVGARSARAQATTLRVVGENYLVSGNTLYAVDGYSIHTLPIPGAPPLPVAPDNILVYAEGGVPGGYDVPGSAIVTLDGTVWGRYGTSGWTILGAISGGATPAQQRTLGQLKARYR